MSRYMISVVTVCYNCESSMEETMCSVEQQYPKNRYEYVIVDGASTDGTLPKIMKFSEQNTGNVRMDVKWISEPDQGIYNAMNKAVELCQGDYILFMNSGDTLEAGVLEKIEQIIMHAPDSDILYGDANVIFRSGETKLKKYKTAVSNVTRRTLQNGMGMSHQSMFTKKAVIRELGGFDEKFAIGADWDLLIRCYAAGKRITGVHFTICTYTKDGVSSHRHNRERHQIRKSNGLYHWFDWHYLMDVLEPGNIFTVLFGQEKFYACQIKYNRWKEKT